MEELPDQAALFSKLWVRMSDLESLDIWHPIFWRIISVSLSIKLVWSGGLMWQGLSRPCLLFFLSSGWVWVRRESTLHTHALFALGFLHWWLKRKLNVDMSIHCFLNLSLFPFCCQNEMLTVCSALSSLSWSLWASELLIACDCWHCWAYPLFSTGNKI